MYILKEIRIDVELSTKNNSLREVHRLSYMCIDYWRSYIYHVFKVILCKYTLACNKKWFLQSETNAFHNGWNKRHLNLKQWPHMLSRSLLAWPQHQPPTEVLLWTSHHPMLHNEGAFLQPACQVITSSICECTFGSFACSINVLSQLVTVNAVLLVFKSYDVSLI